MPNNISISLSAQGSTMIQTGKGKKNQHEAKEASVGSAVTINVEGLDPALPSSLYKGEWVDEPGFLGWKYLYYRGYDEAESWSTEEAQDAPGIFRYRVCQYVQKGNNWENECSDYVHLVVS